MFRGSLSADKRFLWVGVDRYAVRTALPAAAAVGRSRSEIGGVPLRGLPAVGTLLTVESAHRIHPNREAATAPTDVAVPLGAVAVGVDNIERRDRAIGALVVRRIPGAVGRPYRGGQHVAVAGIDTHSVIYHVQSLK